MFTNEEGKAKALVELKDVNVTAGSARILSEITWRLMPGESWAVLGGNGAGKSTFLKLVRGDIWPAAQNGGQRIYNLDGRPQESPIGFKEATAWVSPELLLKYQRMAPRLSGRDLVLTGLFNTALLYDHPTAAQKELADSLLSRLGLSDLAERDIAETSSGQAMRLLIARALIAKPLLLFLDECCHGLDKASRAELLAMLERLAQDGAQIIYTTHRPDETINAAGQVLLLENGKVADCGPACRVLQSWQNASRSESPSLPLLGPAPARREPAPPFLFKLRRATAAIEGKRVLFDLNWEMTPGQNWAVLGGNGAGKSTFLNLLAGDLRPVWGGEVGRFGSFEPMELGHIRQRAGLVGGRMHDCFFRKQSVLETVAAALYGATGLVCHRAGEDDLAKAWATLALVGIGNLAERDIHTLSAGQLRKTMIARALAVRPRVLLLDEPLRGLDLQSRQEVTRIFQHLAITGTGLVYVSHHGDELPPAISHVLKLARGRAVFCGEMAEYRRAEAA